MYTATVSFNEWQPPKLAAELQLAFANAGIVHGPLQSQGAGRTESILVQCQSLGQVGQVILAVEGSIGWGNGVTVYITRR